METKENLINFLESCVKSHTEVDINIIIPAERSIKAVLDRIGIQN